MFYKEITLQLAFGEIAAISWGEATKPKILALHGWLDSAASFDKIAPLLIDYNVIAIDLPGHGLSSHSKGFYLHITDIVGDIINILDQLELQNVILMGHSLGAAIACLLASSFPERFSLVACIDALGPFTFATSIMPTLVKESILEYKKLANKKIPRYKSVEQAIAARLKASPMKLSSVTALVKRSLKKDKDSYCWRNDKRLLLTPYFMLVEEQMEAFLHNIAAPVCLVKTGDGWPFGEEIFISRAKCIKNLEVNCINGQHHVHLDEPVAVANIFNNFFQKYNTNEN